MADHPTDRPSTPVAPTDRTADPLLVQKIREGDRRAFEELYYRYYKPVYGFLLKITRSEADTEDIVQDLFAHLWNIREKIEPSKNIKALIFTIARRSAVDLYRRSGKMGAMFSGEQTEGNPASDLSPEEILQDHETKLLVSIAIEQMPARQREVFLLYYNENLTAMDITSRLDMSYENVRKHIYNGKKHLREMIMFIAAFLLS